MHVEQSAGSIGIVRIFLYGVVPPHASPSQSERESLLGSGAGVMASSRAISPWVGERENISPWRGEREGGMRSFVRSVKPGQRGKCCHGEKERELSKKFPTGNNNNNARRRRRSHLQRDAVIWERERQ